MCGRFSLSGEVDFYADYFGVAAEVPESLRPSWNVAPTDQVYTVAERDGTRGITSVSWGLVPHWAKDRRSIHINARLETVRSTPTFRDSFAKRRCLIPADGFYEWEPKDAGGQPHWLFRADGYPVGFAGLWSSWRDPATGDWHRTCAIITTRATGVVAKIHDRMPVALREEQWQRWLSRDLVDPAEALQLVDPVDPELWMERPVSKLVNSVRNNGPELQGADTQLRLL